MAETAPAEGSEAQDAGAVARIVVERPPPGLAQGRYPWPPWGILLLGGSIVAIALSYLAWRMLRARKR